ncbi:MAG: AraC family transcriptional regulator [Bacteroidota bacterium]
MKHYVAFFCCLHLLFSSAQNSKQIILPFEKAEKLHLKYVYKNDSLALAYAIQAKNAAIVNDDSFQKVKGFYYVSKTLHLLDRNKEALKNMELAISNSASVQDTVLLYNCLLFKGSILSELGDNTRALKAYLEALAYAEAMQDAKREVACLTNIAFVKRIHKDFQEAIDLYKKVLERLAMLDDDSGKKVNRLITLLNIADIYLWLQKPDEAEIYNKEALEDCCEKRTAFIKTPLLLNTAIIHYQRVQYADCIKISKQIRDATQKDKKRAAHLTALFYLGKSAFKLENYQDAIQYLEKTLDILNTTDTKDINEKEVHEFLAHLYIKVKNATKSEYHFQKYAALEKKQSAENLKINNETHELIDKKPLRNEINEIKNDLAAQKQTQKIIFSAAIVLLMLLIGSVVFYRRREKISKKKFQELLKKVSQLEKKELTPKSNERKEKVTDTKARAILNKIADFEKNEYFLLLECSLGFMAAKLGTNTSYLSKVINKYKKKSYTSYITELRINTALVRLKNDSTLQSYTIKAIAEEFGFKRQETFSKAFKSQTGIYPSQYLKNLKKEA